MLTDNKKEIPWIQGAFQNTLEAPNNAKGQWYINDHCILVDSSDQIHWFGITNPYPEDGKLYGPGSHRHIGHAVAAHPFGPWTMREHAFSLPDGTTENIGACFVVLFGSEYRMIYTYNEAFHFARSDDMDDWQKLPEAGFLDLGPATRDPCVLQLDDGSYLLYGTSAVYADMSAIVLASSHDLIHWKTEPPALISNVQRTCGALESPFVYRRGEEYYLFLNFSHRQYQETLVFHSRDPHYFDWNSPVCTLFAHAAELFDWRGQLYITHCGIEDRHWSKIGAPYGLWLAELQWAKPIMANNEQS